jgi:hypothetical protein
LGDWFDGVVDDGGETVFGDEVPEDDNVWGEGDSVSGICFSDVVDISLSGLLAEGGEISSKISRHSVASSSYEYIR